MLTLRSYALLLVLLVLPALAVCGGEGGGGEAASEGGAEAEAGDGGYAFQVESPATVSGSIAFQGDAPAPSPIDMSEEPTCAARHSGGAATEEVVVNQNGTLRNAFVWVKEGLPDREYPVPGEPVVLDQQGCVYHPHVVGVQTGQRLVLKNSDGLLHNINAKPSSNRGFNISQPRNMESTRTFSVQEVMIPVECDVHGWMKAYVGVVDHPYFAVTGDDGSFTIRNLPPGNYVLETWHERFGTQTMNVTVGPNESKEATFTYTPAMARNAVVPLGRAIDPHNHAAGHGGHAARAGAAGR